MFTATFLYEQCAATVNENHHYYHHHHPWIRSFDLFRHPVNENDWLNKHSETGLFLENFILFKVFVGSSVTSRSRSIKGTNCHPRNKIPVKICCPVSFSIYLEMATDTVHFA